MHVLQLLLRIRLRQNDRELAFGHVRSPTFAQVKSPTSRKRCEKWGTREIGDRGNIPLFALRLMRLHVGAQDGIDAGLIAVLAAEPAQQVGVEAHGDRFFWRGQHHLGRFPECGVRGVRVGITGYPFTDRSRLTATQARPVGPAVGFRGCALCPGSIALLHLHLDQCLTS
jgi:hypothetical protein